jgi:(p)ppGpp synthase/HD superfamily hydrolase
MKKGELLDKALLIATNAHHGQYDKGGAPYILHPIKVMHYLKSDDEELMAIALLHDVVEDTDVTYQDLKDAGMTIRVVDAVRKLTKVKGLTHEEYKSKILESTDAMRVKMADLRHNSDIRRLKGVTEKDIKRIEKYHRFYVEIKAELERVS